jgi:hypothetical protein
MQAGRTLAIFGFGIVAGVLGAMLWPKSTFERCMLDFIHDPKKLEGAYWMCKGHPRKPANY